MRRAFLGAAALAVPAAAMQSGAAGRATLAADLSATPVRFDRMIFGQFLEHFHRQVYGGVFEPGSPLTDANLPQRCDRGAARVASAIVRWPGGCFVFAYHWKDGVGHDRQPSLR